MTDSKAALKRIRLLTSPCLMMPRWIGNSCPCCANTSLTMINGSETITIRLWHALLFNVRPYSTRSNALVKSRFAHHTRRFHWRLLKPRKKTFNYSTQRQFQFQACLVHALLCPQIIGYVLDSATVGTTAETHIRWFESWIGPPEAKTMKFKNSPIENPATTHAFFHLHHFPGRPQIGASC